MMRWVARAPFNSFSNPSTPSYRYAYLLWMVFALMAIIYAVAHHARLSGGSLGAAWARIGIRRYVLGSKRPGSKNRALPSNNINVTLALIAIVTIILSLIGADYVVPSSSVLDFSTSFRKRGTNPGYTINKSLWTLGSRFGFMAFALMPLVVLFALKAAPVAILSIKWFTDVHHDKLAMLHRGVAWLIWFITTAHVVLWTVQLFQDQYNGKATWIYLISTNYRFICGCVAYFFMTALMVLSLRPVRKNRYEFFYIAHVTLVLLTLVASAVHHPVLWYWIVAAGGLWALERAVRFARLGYINGFFGKRSELVAGMRYTNVPTDEYGMQDLKHHNAPSPRRVVDKTLPRAPSASGLGDSHDEFGSRGHSDYYDEGSVQAYGAYESKYSDPYADPAPLPHQRHPSSQMTYAASEHTHERRQSSVPTLTNATITTAPEIPVGYAYAQLLPSRTVRLTIRVPRPFKWAPGQSALLYLPEISRYQSHPFTIVNNTDDEIVLLVKARKGLTRRLFNLVRSRSLASVGVHAVKDKRLSIQSFKTNAGADSVQVPPVNLRVWIDGPFGSASRVRWDEYASVVIICGGSGVSFGAVICDYVCRLMAKSAQNGSTKVKTQRVRFCWVVREYAEIAWVAGQLYRCQQMVPSTRLEISIFVTKSSRAVDDLSLPKPRFAAHSRSDSRDSIASDMSTDSRLDVEEPSQAAPDPSIQYADVLDLTNYDDEEDVNDPAEQVLSDRIQHQGKVRRAKSRRAARKSSANIGLGAAPRSAGYPPRRPMSALSNEGNEYPPHPQPRRIPSALGLQQDNYERPPSRRTPSALAYDDGYVHDNDTSSQGHSNTTHSHAPSYATNAPHSAPITRGSSYQENAHLAGPPSAFGSRLPSYQGLAALSGEGPLEPPRPLSKTDHRQSWRSIADSTYGIDPSYTLGDRGGPSPSPSIFFDDAGSITGDSIKGLLPTRASRTGSMVLLEDSSNDPTNDAALWIDQADFAAMNVVSEMAVPGKPKLSAVLEEELDRATGATIVATCGPATLNTVVRNLVAKNISPGRIRHGDQRGKVVIYSEDYES